MLSIYKSDANNLVSIQKLTPAEYNDWFHKQRSNVRDWMYANYYDGNVGSLFYVPNLRYGSIDTVVMVLEKETTVWDYVNLVPKLHPYVYKLDKGFDAEEEAKFALALGLVAYEYIIYQDRDEKVFPAVFAGNSSVNYDEINSIVTSIHLVRDLINTPANDLGPMELAKSAIQVAKPHTANVNIIEGDDLLSENYPAIYTVGMGSERDPLLVDFTWGNESHPKITLVGKGVCFDSGGLDLKPAQNMLLMKKDMAGAAHVLGLAKMVMEANLPVRLRVLIPAVENSVSGNAYRPLDVIKMRSGKTVEVGNTDAEGRLILADTLTEADAEKPELIIDIATLTGAARVALGTELPALFSNNDEIASQIIKSGQDTHDPFWQLPLWQPYRSQLKSKVADISSTGASTGGAITAALFLSEFMPNKSNWVHIDMMAWNTGDKPGKPEGGEAMGLRALYAFIKNYVIEKSPAPKKSKRKGKKS